MIFKNCLFCFFASSIPSIFFFAFPKNRSFFFVFFCFFGAENCFLMFCRPSLRLLQSASEMSIFEVLALMRDFSLLDYALRFEGGLERIRDGLHDSPRFAKVLAGSLIYCFCATSGENFGELQKVFARHAWAAKLVQAAMGQWNFTENEDEEVRF